MIEGAQTWRIRQTLKIPRERTETDELLDAADDEIADARVFRRSMDAPEDGGEGGRGGDGGDRGGAGGAGGAGGHEGGAAAAAAAAAVAAVAVAAARAEATETVNAVEATQAADATQAQDTEAANEVSVSTAATASNDGDEEEGIGADGFGQGHRRQSLQAVQKQNELDASRDDDVPEFAIPRSGQLAVVVKRGVGLKNVESMMYKMDPYVQVKAGWGKGGGGGNVQRTA